MKFEHWEHKVVGEPRTYRGVQLYIFLRLPNRTPFTTMSNEKYVLLAKPLNSSEWHKLYVAETYEEVDSKRNFCIEVLKLVPVP